MKIRLAKENEVSALSKIAKESFSKSYGKLAYREIRAMFTDAFSKPIYFAAEKDGKLVGFAGFAQSWMDYNVYEIFWVNVKPKYQNQGIGTSIVKRIIQEIKSKKGMNKAKIILLTADSPKFYKNLGFRIILKYGKDCLMSLKLR